MLIVFWIYTRLNHLAISVSYSSVLRLGKDHDIILRKWQQQLNDIIRVSCETNCDHDASCHSRSVVIAQLSEVENQCLTSPMLEHNYAAASRTVVNKYITV